MDLKQLLYLTAVYVTVVYGEFCSFGKWDVTLSDKTVSISMYLEETSNSTKFTMSSTNIESYEYIALGISKDQMMPATDIYMAYLDVESNVVISDQYAAAKSKPTVDDSQDTTITSGSYTDKTMNVEFMRSVNTGDANDWALDDKNQCYYLLFATGPYTGGGASKHTGKTVSTIKYCPVCSTSKSTKTVSVTLSLVMMIVVLQILQFS